MTIFLPPSTNDQYQGSRLAAWGLTVYAIGWIIPGMIHSFLPDGGAGTIARLDLSHNPTMIFAMFAWAGATQIVHGIVTLIVALRYRTLVPLFLLVSLIERLLLSWSAWVKHVPASGQHPPEHFASLICVPLLLLFLWLSVQDRKLQSAEPL